jgi:hypothetical protein
MSQVLRRPVVWAIAPVVLAALVVYGLTLTPGVGLIDSGELILAAYLPGVPHPPGTPLYVLLGWLFAQLPVGSVALRLNLFSAVCTAAAAGLVALAAWQMRPVANARPAPRAPAAPAADDRRVPVLVALGAGLAFAFSYALWAYAVVAEVYGLHITLLAGVIAALFAWRRESQPYARRDRWLYVAALLFGLALTVHSITALTLAPGIAYLVLAHEWPVLGPWLGRLGRGRRASKAPVRRARKEPGAPAAPTTPAAGGPSPVVAFWRTAGLALLCILAGLLVYAYLPLRAAGKPLLNWGDPSTWQNFWWHVTGKWYQTFFTPLNTTPLQRALQFLALVGRQQYYLGALIALLGVWSLWKRDRALLIFLVLMAAGNLMLFANYDVQQDSQAYIFPALPVLALLIGEGLRWLLTIPPVATWLAQRGALQRAGALVLVLLVPVVALVANYRDNDHSRDWLAEDYAHNMLASLRPDAVLLTSEWDVTIAPLLYVQHVAGARPDVTVIDVNLLRRSWYAQFVRAADPKLYADVQEPYRLFLESLTYWEQGNCPTDSDELQCTQIQFRFESLVTSFVSAGFTESRPVYLTGEVDLAVHPNRQDNTPIIAPTLLRVPEGLAYRFYVDNRFYNTPEPEFVIRGLTDGSVPLLPGTAAADLVPKYYVDMFVARGQYLMSYDDKADAKVVFGRALAINPDNTAAQLGLAAAQK